MARVPDDLLRCAFFLYRSRKHAEEGSPRGGSGFFVGVDWTDNPDRRHVYAVTNKHNITACRDSVVIRATKLDGELDLIETDPVEWHPSPLHDISIRPIEPSKAALFQNVSDGLFVERDNFRGLINGATCLGPGDEVFMIGRFISHDGIKRNHPSTRFGNLSMLAAPIKRAEGGTEESFAVDMRSISGYSGSPAFICWEFASGNLKGVNRTFVDSFLALLGVDWGHISMRLDVMDAATGEPRRDGSYVKSHTSMAGVVPAWHLRELLSSEIPEQQRMRDEQEATNP
jgi:hypothetical protein